jgi:hypothetical protein
VFGQQTQTKNNKKEQKQKKKQQQEKTRRSVRELCHGSNVVPSKQADLRLRDVMVV